MSYNADKSNIEGIMKIANELKKLGAIAEGYGDQIGIMAGLVLIARRIDDLEVQVALCHD